MSEVVDRAREDRRHRHVEEVRGEEAPEAGLEIGRRKVPEVLHGGETEAHERTGDQHVELRAFAAKDRQERQEEEELRDLLAKADAEGEVEEITARIAGLHQVELRLLEEDEGVR